jgi:phytoene dehydrogenase-like protein
LKVSDKQPDAIVIGAGHNGLAAALHLLARGWTVHVLERSDHVGGCAATAEIAPGFRGDLAAMNLSLFAGSAFHGTYGDELARHGLGFVPAQNPFASVFPDGTWLGVSTDLDTTAARIAALSESDAQTWRDMAAAFPGEAEHIGGLLGTPMTRRALARFAWKTWRAKGTAWMLDTVRMLLSSPRAWLDGQFEHPKVKAMMAAWGMHLDFAPEIAGGAVFPYLESMANQSFGMVIGKGGADTMPNALAAAIADRGGRIDTGAEVSQILTANGKATGVRLADGREMTAAKAVIACTTPAALLRLTGGTGDARYDRSARAFAHAPGTFMLHLALDDLPDWSAGAELRDFAYVHLAPSLEAMNLAYVQAKAGLLPTEPVLVVGQPTVVDPSRAPGGKHVLWVQVRMAPGTILGDARGEIAATDWDAAKEPFTARVLDILEGYAPGLRGRIVGQHAMSPADLEAWNPNLVGGDQIAGSHHIAQNFLFRPVRGHADWSTPLDGLHLIGASTWPGAGTGAGSGYMLARHLAGP